MMAIGGYKKAEKDGTYDRIERDYGYKDNEPLEDASGYRSVLFTNELTGDLKLAFAGTDDVPDIGTDIWQGIFGGTRQYELIESDVRNLEKEFGKITDFTGHSLGGGLASAAALVFKRPAVTFNAAGVHPATLEAYGTNADNANILIDAYRVQGEFLSTIQNAGSTWEIIGLITHDYGLAMLGHAGEIAPDGTGRAFWLKATSVDMMRRHMMSDVIAGMNKAIQ